MALTGKTINKALTAKFVSKLCWQIEWRVIVPRVGKCVESPTFHENGRSWSCKFVSSCAVTRNDEKWEIEFRRQGSVPENVVLTVQIESKNGRHLITSSKDICVRSPCVVLECFRDMFLYKYNVDFSKNTLTFIFTFDYGIRSYKDYQKENKSVQTDRPPSIPCYFDDRWCLENLSLQFSKLMDDGSDPDVRLKCGDRTIHAHSLILGARSEVFRTMLHSDMQEGKDGTVKIVDMDPEVLQLFVRYLYTGRLPELSVDTALPLFEAGDKYQVEALKDRCRDFLGDKLTRETAFEVLATADAHGEEALKDGVISYILEEEIPKNEDVWLKFCDSHPKLAIQVLNFFYKETHCCE